MALLVPDIPQDAALAQHATQEALVEKNKICAMEQDAPIPEVTPRTCSNQGRALSFKASHKALTSTDLTSQEMAPMTQVLQRLDSQDI